MNVGERIRDRRQELGLTVDYVAARLKIDRATLYRYENNDISKLPITILEPLATVLKTTPAALMGWDDHPSNKDELDITDIYYRAKESDQIAVKTLLKAIDKLLSIDEQDNGETK